MKKQEIVMLQTRSRVRLRPRSVALAVCVLSSVLFPAAADAQSAACEPQSDIDRPCPDLSGAWSNPDNRPSPQDGQDVLVDSVPTDSGIVAAVGWTAANDSDGSWGTDSVAVGFDDVTGSVRWVNTRRSEGLDFPTDAEVTPGGDVILVAGVSGFEGPETAFPFEGVPTIAALDVRDGALLWIHELEGHAGVAQGVAAGILRVSGEEIPVAYVTSTVNASGEDGYETDVLTTALRLDDRTVLWEMQHDDPDHAANPESVQRHDLAREVLVSPSGDTVYVAAESEGAGDSGRDFLALAYDAATGELLWRGRYNGPIGNGDHVQAAAISEDGGTLVLTGYLQGHSTDTGTNFDFGTVAFDAAAGTRLWSRTYGGAENGGQNVAFDLVVQDDRVWVAGPASAGDAHHDYDFGVVSYRLSDGTDALPPLRYDARTWDVAQTLAISPRGEELYVSGYSQSLPGGARGLSTRIGWVGPVAIQPTGHLRTLALDADTGVVRWVAEHNSGELGVDSHFPGTAYVSEDGESLLLGVTLARGYDPDCCPTGDGWNFFDLGMVGYRLGATEPKLLPPEEPPPTPVRQTTVVTWSGQGGVKLVVPEGVEMRDQDLRVTTSGKYALAGISHGPCEGLCFYQQVFGLSDIETAPGLQYNSRFAQPDGAIAAGVNDLYLLTDGKATLTLTFHGAPEGVVGLEPTHAITAEVEELPSGCDMGPICRDLRYGGETRTLNEGWAGMIAYAGSSQASDPFVNPGSAFASACASPEFFDPGGTPQPEEHGCPFIDQSQPNSTAIRVANLLVGNTWIDGPNVIQGHYNFNGQGPVYLGFQTRQTGVQTQGHEYQRNFVFWIEKGLVWSL